MFNYEPNKLIEAYERSGSGASNSSNRDRLQKAYIDRRQQQIDAIPLVGRGAVTFKEVDDFFRGNPDANFVRIANATPTATSGIRIGGNFGAAGIVSQQADKTTNARSPRFFSSTNRPISSQARRGDANTLEFSPTSFYETSGIDVIRENQNLFGNDTVGQLGRSQLDYARANDGLIFSREEYGNFKSQAKNLNGVDFLDASKKQPNPQDSPSIEKAKQAPRPVSRARSAINDETSSLRKNEETKNNQLGNTL